MTRKMRTVVGLKMAKITIYIDFIKMEVLIESFYNAVLMAFVCCASLLLSAIIEICGNECWLAQTHSKYSNK